MINDVATALGTNAYNSNPVDQAKGKSSLGKDDFMKLMISQMKYQDPTNPMDSSQFSAQLAQFSSLEQLTNMNESLKTSINANYLLTKSVNNTMSTALIGKDIKLGGSGIIYNGQKDVSLGYKLPSDGKEVTMKIYDGNGKLVKTIENMDSSAGSHKLSWDFSDDNGNKLPEGNYSFEVTAKSTNGENMATEIFKYGNIDSVRFTESGTKIVIGNAEYDLSDVLEIYGSTGSGGI